MPVEVEEVINLMSSLAEEEGLKVAVAESAKGGLIAGAGAMVGGLLMGPPGIFIGGALGGAAGCAATYGKFKPVALVILELPQDKRTRLYNQAKSVLDKLTIQDGVALVMLVSADAGIKMELMAALKAFVMNDMSMKILE